MPSNEGALRAASDPTRVLIIGGSYAGLATAVTLLDVCNGKKCRFAHQPEDEATPKIVVPIEITIVDERDGYYHLIGSPLSFASRDYASMAWKVFGDIPAMQNPSIKTLQGSVVSVNPAAKRATFAVSGSNERIEHLYDYLVVATGLRREYPSVPQSLDRLSYLAETKKHITSVQHADRGVVVVGGGAVGVEMAAELKLVEPDLKVTLIHSRDKLLSSENLPDEFKDKTLDLVREAGVETIMNDRVMSTAERLDHSGKSYYELELKDGKRVEAGHVINAVSRFHPTTSFMPSSTVDNEGYIKIRASLAFTDDAPNPSHHFAAGDIAKWSGIKRCGAAMHHGHLAGVNLYQQILKDSRGLELEPLKLDENIPPSIGLAVGKQTVTYNTFEGVKWGEDMTKLYFGDDLGYKICWNYMRLGESA